MLEVVLILLAVLVSQVMQVVDDFLSQVGGISLLHGLLLGSGQIQICKLLLEWGGARLGWLVVALVGLAALTVSLIKIHRTGSRWIFAFNFGVIVGIFGAGVVLI
ncbi:MAG: hypothetical protein EOL86_09865 [Deltaproteobacteria bacterium]|nr:hypothetical protein [Deltaproteobacteria bacterium]